MISAGIVEPLITARTCGVLGVHVWGRACDPDGLQALCERRGLALMFDACHAVGSTHRGVPIGGFGAGEAFSFHATKVLNGGEGGCITTNDAGLAARLRTIRNFHPGETFVPVPTRMNGKMSEAQAALALLSLRQLPASIEANRRRHAAYAAVLGEVPGLELLQYDPGEANSHQYVVVEIDPELSGLDRDVLLTALQAENILCRRHFYPGLHRMPPFAAAGQTLPVTDRLCRRLLQLPNSQSMTVEDATRVGETILSIHASREALRARA
jgi:dTDP-4-amino-4,6-dideoxygalactose transaminase